MAQIKKDILSGVVNERSFALKLTRSLAMVLLSALILVATAITSFAQDVNSTIAGYIYDENKAVIAGANVQVENAEFGVKRNSMTNGEGYFTIPNLPVGIYRLTIEAEGFARYVQENLKTDVGKTFSLNVTMSIKQQSAEVTVTDETYQTINKDNANVETLISGTQVTELALNGRNWVQLVNLAPGTSAFNNDTQQGTSVRLDDVAINGLRRRAAPTIDGAGNVDHGSVATQVNNISVDAIQEFKLVSSPYSAEYGAQAGPAINVVTKRGTNKFHGSLFEFIRHDSLNSFSWESKQANNPEKAYLRFNNFGGFVGGPILKDRVFFFGGMEWKRPRTGRSISADVPTLAMRNGDFSAFLPPGLPAGNTSCTPAGVTIPAGTFILCDRSGAAAVSFPNNVIPAAKMSPNGLRIAKLFPAPNAGTGTYIASPITVRNVRQEVLRVDYQINQSASVFGRWLRDNFDSDNPTGSTFDNQTFPIAPDNHIRLGKTFLLSYTQIINPTMINEMTFVWQRNDQNISYQDEAQINRNTYGINFTEIFPANRLNKIPEVDISGYPTISGNGLPYDIKARSWELRDNLTYSYNAHTFKFGYLYINSFKSENTRVRDGGTIQFRTGSNLENQNQDSRNAFANLLLGAYSLYSEPADTTNAPASYDQFEFYANDQWRVNSRLSLNFGLRLQYIPWPTTDLGNIVGFDIRRFDPNKAPLAANIQTNGTITGLTADPTGQGTRAQGFFDPYNGLILPGSPTGNSTLDRLRTGLPSGLADSGNIKLAPRFGFAFDPFGDGKTSIRGGAGIYYDRTLLNPIRDAGVNTPFSQTAQLRLGRQFTAPAVTGFGNPLDTVGAVGTGTPLLQSLTVFDSNMPPGVVYAYSVDVQRLLPWDVLFSIGYVGNQARHLTHRRDINHVLPDVALARNASGAFINTNTNRSRQYLGYTTILQQENTGSSSYNSMQTSFQKRLTKGFTASLAYTWSKALTNFNNETDNLRTPFDASLDKGPAEFDRRHVLAVSYVYELPLYKQQKGFVGRILGGWQISGITTVQSGRYFNLSGGTRASTSPTIGFGSNLDLIGDWRAVQGGQTPGNYVNRAAFTGRVGLIGTAPKNLLQLPTTHNWNLSFMKRTNIKENIKLQFRAEIFNLFNHPNFRTIVTDFNSSSFGRLTETDEPRVFQFGLKILF